MFVELKDINKSFGTKHVLKNMSFKAESGRALGLLGRNGAGKTTTIRIFMDVFKSDSGSILIDGKAPDYNKLVIGYLPEERGLYPKVKIIDQLVYFTELKGTKRKEAVKSVDYWLERLKMSDHRNNRLDTLSKGNQQKIQLITAVAANPDIVILDEPFSGLDPVNSILLKDVVKELISTGKVVIFSSHQMSYVEEFCDDIAILNKGEIVLSGDLRKIIRSYPRDRLAISSTEIERISRDLSLENYIEKDELIVKLKKPEDKPMVMKALFDKYDLDGIRVYEPSLNDIFVEYADNSDIMEGVQ